MTAIDEILEALTSVQDKVVLHPLSPAEVDRNRAQLTRPMPPYYTEFLRKIGLKQDLVWGLNHKISQFKDLGDFLPSSDYFQFGDNGGDDYWLLRFGAGEDRMVYAYEYYREGAIKPLGKTFYDLLWEGLRDTKKRYDHLAFNDAKVWRVQFSLGTVRGQFMVHQLRDKLEVPIELIQEPVLRHTTAAGVKHYEGSIAINQREIRLKKQILKGAGRSHLKNILRATAGSFSPLLRCQKRRVAKAMLRFGASSERKCPLPRQQKHFEMASSHLYFDWQESVDEMKSNSVIERLDRALAKCSFKHTLIDYGIMNKAQLEDGSDST